MWHCYAMDLAEKYTPAVALLEDLDRIIQAKDISLSHFLNLLDGLNVPERSASDRNLQRTGQTRRGLASPPEPIRPGLAV